jgi:acetyl esterase
LADDAALETIDPEIREFVDTLLGDYARVPGYAEAPLTERRRIAGELRKRWSAGGPQMASTEDFAIDVGAARVGLRLFRPAMTPSPLPVMIYIHGGGFTTFSVDTHDRLMREYASGYGGAVLGVDYSLSPEARFPVALTEVLAVVDWVDAQHAQRGLDGARVAIGGDSAGANLALSTTIEMRERGDDEIIKAMVLNYGFFSPDLTSGAHQRHGGPDQVLTNAELQFYIDSYCAPGQAQASDPRAWPLLADLHGLPPSFHAIAECDPLADIDRAMVAKLEAAGNDVTSRIYRGATHSFLEAISISSLARRAMCEQCAWLANKMAEGAQLVTAE